MWKYFTFQALYFLLLQNPLYESLHKNAVLKYLIVHLCMCIITK